MNVRHRNQSMRILLAVAAGVALFVETGLTASAELAERMIRVASVGVEDAYLPVTTVEGRLAIAGSDTMRPLLVRLAADFSRNHPKAKLAVEGGGSTEGLREFVLGLSSQRRGDKARGTGTEGASTVTVFASSRALGEKERGYFVSRFGYEPTEMPIAMDAVAVYVHASNPIPHLSLEQLAGIYGTATATTTWGQLGLGEQWSQAPIEPHGRDNRSGTRTLFSEAVLHGKGQNVTAIEEPGSASMVMAIARNPFSIGYAGIGFNISDVRAVPLLSREGVAVPPTADAVMNGSYPLSRSLYLYINSDPASRMHPVLLEFLRYVNSRQGQSVVQAAQAFPLPPASLEKNAAFLKNVQK